MADFFINTVNTTAQQLDSFEFGLISSTGSLQVSGSDAITTTGSLTRLTNDGMIVAYDSLRSAIDADSNEFELLNGPNGLITAEYSSSGLLDLNNSDRAVLVNHGIMHAYSGDVISFFASGGDADFNLTNTGQITTNGEAYYAVAANVGAGQIFVVNEGSITATNYALRFASNMTSAEHSIVNHGTITSHKNEAIYLEMGHSDTVSIINTGDITSADQAIFARNDTNITLTNSGQIATSHSDLDAIRLSHGDDHIRNKGQIIGSVSLNNGDDVFRNLADGMTSGEVDGGRGNDTITGGSHRDLFNGGIDDDVLIGLDGHDFLEGDYGADTLRGGAGNDELHGGVNSDEMYGGSGDDDINGDDGTDLIYGNSGDDTINGGTSDDTIYGGSGEDDIRGGANDDEVSGGSGDDILRGESGLDTLSGGAGDDTLSGSSFNDDLNGGSGDDRLFGGADDDILAGTLGDDYLNGGSGNDLLRGGSDNDTLIGGTGQDTLSGGNGADVFVFSVEGDSPHGATRDVITDFTSGEDMIDLSGFAGDLTFIGGSSYSNTAGEVRYNSAIGRLYIDLDGDGGSDFSVNLSNDPALDAGDLIL